MRAVSDRGPSTRAREITGFCPSGSDSFRSRGGTTPEMISAGVTRLARPVGGVVVRAWPAVDHGRRQEAEPAHDREPSPGDGERVLAPLVNHVPVRVHLVTVLVDLLPHR